MPLPKGPVMATPRVEQQSTQSVSSVSSQVLNLILKVWGESKEKKHSGEIDKCFRRLDYCLMLVKGSLYQARNSEVSPFKTIIEFEFLHIIKMQCFTVNNI